MSVVPSCSRGLGNNEILQALQDDVVSDVDNEDDTDVGSDVNIDEERVDDRNRDTDTEQSGSDNDLDLESDSNSDDDIPLANRGTYVGRDKKTIWKKAEPSASIRTRQRNIIVHLPGTKGQAKNAKTPLEAWQCYFSDDLLQTIVDNTNIYINMKAGHYDRERDARPTSMEEIKALFGLLYYAGVLKSSHLNTEELWNDEGTGVEIFRCVMSQNRFRFLIRMLRFDDKRTREERLATDKLAPIREIFETIVSRCKANFSVAEYTTIDEMLWAFRGRCSFRQYMRNKPAKYGIKVFALVDSKTFYVQNMEVYLGKQRQGPYVDIIQTPSPVVLRLIETISGSNRNVTFDNWFTSLPLSNQLLLQHNLTSVGTIRKNKAEIPPSFLSTANRDVFTSMFGFGKHLTTLVSYVPKKNKVVLLTSTMHHSSAIDPSSGDERKPEVITFYNMTKGGVDVVDEMSSLYSVARKTNRWPLTCFYNLLNVVALNSFVVCMWNNKQVKPVRRKWLKALAKDLVTPFMRSRLQGPLPKVVKMNILNILKENEQPVPVQEEEGEKKRKRCALCDRTGNKTLQRCAVCSIPVCGKHSKVTCQSCFDAE